MEGTSSDFTTWLRRLMPFVMAGIGILFIGVGILINSIKNNQNKTINPIASEQTGTVAGQAVVKSIKIDVSGAVEKPGVYAIPNDSRIADVLITAGGLAPKADRKYLSKYINLAQRISDGMKIYFPFENETTSNPVNLTGLMNINSASSSELDSLPGIGTVTANKIVTGRPYQNISELTSRGIIGKSAFDKIKDKITTD